MRVREGIYSAKHEKRGDKKWEGRVVRRQQKMLNGKRNLEKGVKQEPGDRPERIERAQQRTDWQIYG